MDSVKTRMHGKIKFFNEARGFGFICPDTAGPDIFVHVTALPSDNSRARWIFY